MAWTNKTKVSTNKERGRILTPDGSQVLVGASETEILIYQAEETEWLKKTKNTS